MKPHAHDLEVPVAHRYFEDYRPGSVCIYGPVTMREEDIVEFAVRYDPQPIHTDPRAAAAGPFGGLIASGWHTIAVVMRVLVENYLSHVGRACLARGRRAALARARASGRCPARARHRARGDALALEDGPRARPDGGRNAQSARRGGDELQGNEPDAAASRPAWCLRATADGCRCACGAVGRVRAHVPRKRTSTAPPPPACGGASQ